MKKYYLHDGSAQSGPFNLQELQEKQITHATPIWYEGLSGWTTAGEVSELNNLLKIIPPPLPNKIMPPPANTASPLIKEKIVYKSNLSQTTSKPGSGLKRVFQVAALLLLVVVIGASVVNYRDKMGSNPFDDNNNYVQKVMTVEEIEQADPAKFIKSSGQYKQTILGNKFRIFGKVTNNATVAKYKDISIQINYYSETETLLHSETYVLYEYLTPRLSKEFEIKVNRPAGSTKIGLETIGAIPY